MAIAAHTKVLSDTERFTWWSTKESKGDCNFLAVATQTAFDVLVTQILEYRLPIKYVAGCLELLAEVIKLYSYFWHCWMVLLVCSKEMYLSAQFCPAFSGYLLQSPALHLFKFSPLVYVAPNGGIYVAHQHVVGRIVRVNVTKISALLWYLSRHLHGIGQAP